MDSSLTGPGAPTTTGPSQAIDGVTDRVWAWNREPVAHSTSERTVTWTCPGGTDFWRTTEGVAPAHDGCSLLTLVEGDFEIEAFVSAVFADRYDQTGLMVVSSELRWVKTGVENDGGLWLSAVHTREQSDWSRESWAVPEVHLRAVRRDSTIEVFVENPGGWRNYRTLYLPGPVGVGFYSCAPKGLGFESKGDLIKLDG